MTKDFYHKEWYQWRDEALRQVRFTPDHDAIAKELYAHYEDHVRDLERIGYDEELARQRALAAMGDAEEVGRGLDAAHKPWLGWLFEATGWLMAALALMLAVTLLKDWWVMEVYARVRDELKWQDPPPYADRVETGFGTLYMAPGRVWEEEGLTLQSLDFWARMDAPQGSRPEGLKWRAEVTTDQGPMTVPEQDEAGDWPESGYYNFRADSDFYAMDGYTRYQWSICFVVEEPLEWAEVRYPFYDWVLRGEWEAAE